MMRVELSRFRVKPGKSTRVDEWLGMLNERMAEVKETPAREEMKVEVIFREIIEEDEFLYWSSIQGEAGEIVRSSPCEIDQLHIAFHEESIDHDYGMRDDQPQVIMIPDGIARAMAWGDPPEDSVPSERAEIINIRG